MTVCQAAMLDLPIAHMPRWRDSSCWSENSITARLFFPSFEWQDKASSSLYECTYAYHMHIVICHEVFSPLSLPGPLCVFVTLPTTNTIFEANSFFILSSSHRRSSGSKKLFFLKNQVWTYLSVSKTAQQEELFFLDEQKHRRTVIVRQNAPMLLCKVNC